MASPVPPTILHVYVTMQFQMSENVNSIDGGLICHYVGIDDILLIGGLDRSCETWGGGGGYKRPPRAWFTLTLRKLHICAVNEPL